MHIILYCYKALVRPHPEFANSVWSPFPRLSSILLWLKTCKEGLPNFYPGIKILSAYTPPKILNLPILAYRRPRGDLCYRNVQPTFGWTFQIVELWIRFGTGGITRGHSKKKKKKKIRSNITNRVLRKCFFLPTELLGPGTQLARVWVGLLCRRKWLHSFKRGWTIVGRRSRPC